jgi:hypothetical protein
MDRDPRGRHGEALIPERIVTYQDKSRKQISKNALQNNYVWCHKCREWVKRKYYAIADKEGQGCYWQKKCPLCQQYCNNKLVDSQLCHKVVNEKVVVANDQIQSATSSPRTDRINF